MTNGLTVARFAGGLLRGGIALFALGLTAGLALLLHCFYVTPFEICSASFSTMAVTEVWPWALPLLATQGLALTLIAFGLSLIWFAGRERAINHAHP